LDDHLKVLRVGLEVLNTVLYSHAKDLLHFMPILIGRILNLLGSERLLTSVQTRLFKTLGVIR
jgi:hypothetical protein